MTKQEFDEYVQARNKALGNVTITCTATFNDGAQKSVNQSKTPEINRSTNKQL